MDEYAKNQLKTALVQYDRTLLVADNRRCEPKKFGGMYISYCEKSVNMGCCERKLMATQVLVRERDIKNRTVRERMGMRWYLYHGATLLRVFEFEKIHLYFAPDSTNVPCYFLWLDESTDFNSSILHNCSYYLFSSTHMIYHKRMHL